MSFQFKSIQMNGYTPGQIPNPNTVTYQGVEGRVELKYGCTGFSLNDAKIRDLLMLPEQGLQILRDNGKITQQDIDSSGITQEELFQRYTLLFGPPVVCHIKVSSAIQLYSKESKNAVLFDLTRVERRLRNIFIGTAMISGCTLTYGTIRMITNLSNFAADLSLASLLALVVSGCLILHSSNKIGLVKWNPTQPATIFQQNFTASINKDATETMLCDNDFFDRWHPLFEPSSCDAKEAERIGRYLCFLGLKKTDEFNNLLKRLCNIEDTGVMAWVKRNILKKIESKTELPSLYNGAVYAVAQDLMRLLTEYKIGESHTNRFDRAMDAYLGRG